MSTLLISPSQLYVMQLEVRVKADEYEGFTCIQVHRSVVGAGGPFEEISAPAWSRAVLSEGVNTPYVQAGKDYDVAGLGLTFVVGRQNEIKMSFHGTNPLSAEECAQQIRQATAPLLTAWTTIDGAVAVGTTISGGQSSLSAEGEAASVLGFRPGVVAYGADPRLVLRPGRLSYLFKDYFSSPDFWYKTRLCNESTGAVSNFSAAVRSGRVGDVPSEKIAVGYLRCVSSSGKALQNVRAIIHMEPQLSSVAGAVVTGPPITNLTDENGYVEFSLIKGLEVILSVPDMGFVRSVVVPDADRFDFLSAGIGKNDLFDAKELVIDYAERRNF